MKELKLEKGKKYYPYDSNWVVGTFYNRGATYRFNAKIFYEPSHWGINCGRVSKLWVKNLKLDKEVFDYDRDLLKGTEAMIEKGMIRDLIEFLEGYAISACVEMHSN